MKIVFNKDKAKYILSLVIITIIVNIILFAIIYFIGALWTNIFATSIIIVLILTSIFDFKNK